MVFFYQMKNKKKREKNATSIIFFTTNFMWQVVTDWQKNNFNTGLKLELVTT